MTWLTRLASTLNINKEASAWHVETCLADASFIIPLRNTLIIRTFAII